jgi:G2/mitotic-specific cyclin-B, other
LAFFRSYSDEDIHLIGVVCMLLASKLEDKYPIQIKCIHEQVVFRQFTIWQIMEMERQICKTLDFKLNIATPQEFIQMYVAQLKYYFVSTN